MTPGRMSRSAVAGTSALAGLVHYLVVTGKLTVDTGWGRRVRPLGPFSTDISAPPQVVFDVVAAPYLDATPHAMAGKLRVLERGTDMALAEHYTPVYGGRLTASTLETVTFQRPERIGFRLVRGPVPLVTEQFTLTETSAGTNLGYAGELSTDFWALGVWWGQQVAGPWEAAVRHSLADIRTEAERRVRR